jgi:hypothetical protein
MVFGFRWGAAAACFALSVVAPDLARAQTDHDRAAARSAADAGADAFEQGRYAAALDLFSRAEQLFHAPPHLLFMARSEAKLGRLVDAHETYLKIVKETQSAHAPAAFRKAQAEAERESTAVGVRIAHVTVTIQGAQPTRPMLFMDDVELSSAIVGISFPIDPGVHVFKARAGDAQSNDVSQSFADGAEESVALTLPDAKPASPSRLTATSGPIGNAAPPDSGSAVGAAERTWGIVALAAGAGAIGLGVYFTASSRSSRKSGEALYNECDPGPGCSDDQMQAILRDYSAADRSRTLSVVSYATGGLSVATGLVLLLSNSTHDTAGVSKTRLRHLRIAGGTNWIGAAGSF